MAQTNSRRKQLASWDVVRRRLAIVSAIAFAILGAWLALGTVLYLYLGVEDWIAAFESAAMIAAGMGPLDNTPNGEFGGFLAGLYAIGSLFVGFTVPSLFVAPILHRLLHHYHLEDEDGR